MEKEPDQPENQPAPDPQLPPPFAPDPDIVTLRERGAKDPKKVWHETKPKSS